MESESRLMQVSPTKIVYILDEYEHPYGGTEGQLMQLLRNIDRTRYSPELMLLRDSSFSRNNEFPCGVKVLNIYKIASFITVAKILCYMFYLKKNDIRIAHIFFNDASILVPVFLKLFGIKVIISRRDMGFWYTWSKLFILRFNGYFVDMVIANSRAVKDITYEKEKISKEKIIVIYNGYEEKYLINNCYHGIYNEIGLNEGSKIIGVVANLRPIKRIEDVIKAFPIVLKEHKDAHLVIIGKDYTLNDGSSLRDRLIELSVERNINAHVHFIGGKENVIQYVREFYMGIISSESEGLSNSIIEYMTCSIPTICTRVGGNPELIEHESTGFLYEVGDIDRLVYYIKMLLSDGALTKDIGKNAKKKVTKKFRLEKFLNETIKIYDQVLNISKS